MMMIMIMMMAITSKSMISLGLILWPEFHATHIPKMSHKMPIYIYIYMIRSIELAGNDVVSIAWLRGLNQNLSATFYQL